MIIFQLQIKQKTLLSIGLNSFQGELKLLRGMEQIEIS